MPLRLRGGQAYLQVDFDANGGARFAELVLPNITDGLTGGDPPIANRSASAQLVERTVAALARDEFGSVASTFDPLAATTLGEGGLQRLWDRTTVRLGSLVSTRTPVTMFVTPTFTAYEAGATFVRGKVHVQIEVDTQNEIQQLSIFPGPETRVPGR